MFHHYLKIVKTPSELQINRKLTELILKYCLT